MTLQNAATLPVALRAPVRTDTQETESAAEVYYPVLQMPRFQGCTRIPASCKTVSAF